MDEVAYDQRKKTIRLFDEIGYQINPMTKVSIRSITQQRLVEIAKAFS
ncbi:MAG: hypothetical protein ABI045_03965 [Flavobacteriales bacterium]